MDENKFFLGLCRSCSTMAEMYKSSTPQHLMYMHCKKCISKEYHKRKKEAVELRKVDKDTTIKCRQCGYNRPLSDYYPCEIAESFIGFKARCKICNNANDKLRRQKAKELKTLLKEIV